MRPFLRSWRIRGKAVRAITGGTESPILSGCEACSGIGRWQMLGVHLTSHRIVAPCALKAAIDLYRARFTLPANWNGST